MTKKLIELGCLGLAAWTLSGCSVSDLGNAIYDPVVTTNVVETPTGSYPVVTTNGWTLSPLVTETVRATGAVAPFPWGSLVATGIIALLGIGGHVRGRQWRKACTSGIFAAQKFKQELARLDAEKASKVKAEARVEQKRNRTEKMVQAVLSDMI